MKIVLTGSIGHIGKPLAQALVQKGHAVTVISSTAEREKNIIALGAKAAIGNLQDVDFLAETFNGADVVYTMLALGAGSFFDPDLDFATANIRIGHHLKAAVRRAGIQRVVHLSSIGAHMDEGNGILAIHHAAERILNELPGNISIKFMRPVGFYYNMLAFIPVIKSRGAIVQNYGGDEKEPWVSPSDIAATIAGEMEQPFEGRTIRYIASDEASPNEVAGILGAAIGRPGLKWEEVPDEQFLNGLIASGMNPRTARGFVEMNAARRGGVLYEDYYRHRPALGRIKISDFARDFAAAFNQP
ncbi:NmrA family NAD(P)-binding protein [Compostibacter hankyongensis]|uniref:NmrA family NAD(P)-binding protein n=1 Tax=Compostibacter hankyongensis TaxID=1007089 RepID=A0ABP8FBZ0_9BACT